MDKAPVILLVDDEVPIRMLAAEILSEAGFTVIESASADEALTILQARSDVQLLFTDVNMPGSLDGLALAHIAHEQAPGVSILIGSGLLRPGPGELPPKAQFIAKPYAPSDLTEAVWGLARAY